MTRKTRRTVAFDASFLARPPSGIRTYVEQMVSRLPLPEGESQFAIDFLSGGDGVALPGSRSGKMQQAFWDMVGVARTPASREADLLHIPHLAMPLRSRCPVVVTVHDVIPYTWPEYRRSRTMQLFLRQVERSIAHAAIVIVPSRYVADQLPTVLGITPDRIRVVPMGVELPDRSDRRVDDDERILTAYGLQEGHYLFTIGGFDLRKNLCELVRAFAVAAPGLDPGWKLVIGGAPHTDNMVVYPPVEPLISELQLQDRIVLTGWVDNKVKSTLYRHAGAYVTPSLDEGFGLTALEAMAWGIPTIVSNRGSLPEVVGDAAMIVDPMAEPLANALRTLLADRSAQQTLIQRGMAHARNYTWSETARRTREVYLELLD